jgi:hypothetical protein
MSSFWQKISGRIWTSVADRPISPEMPDPPEKPDPEEKLDPEERTSPEQTSGIRKPGSALLTGARSLVLARLHRVVLRKRRKRRPRQSRIVRLRETVQLSALQMLAPVNDARNLSDEIYARARLERAELTECYTYEQEISRNASKTTGDMPTGQIKLVIPYDGHRYFTREAHADVVNAAKDGLIDPDAEVVVGHLLLTSYAHTDLDAMLNLSEGYGAVPIRMPVAIDGSASQGFDHLTSDRQTCVITYDYAPTSQQPGLHPIDVQMELMDPDSFAALPLELLTEEGFTNNEIVSTMTQQVTFRPYLWLRITVSLHLPCSSDENNDDLHPVISKMALDWPTITSLDALSLTASGKAVPLRYNPETRSIEWSDIPMTAATDPDGDSDIQLYRNSDIVLVIRQPGELYRQPSLDGQVEVEIPDYLMSGLDARLYGATGALSRTTKPKVVSKISTKIHLILDDAFAKRTFSPWQQLYFDEIVPEEARITDIVTALQDRGFLVEPQLLPNDREDRFLVAKRREGPDFMVLWLLIERQRYKTERENKVPGGHTYKSAFESGELRVFIRGTLPRDSCEMTHEMNALQHALRERFDRVRARR